MRRSAPLLVLLGVVSMAFAGVGGYWLGHEPPRQLSGVAVVDLDGVARQLGVDIALEKQITDQRFSLDQQLQALQASARQQLQQKAEELKAQRAKDGSPLEPSEFKRQLVEVEKNLNVQLAQAQQLARNKLAVYRNGLLQDFRNRVAPVAQKAASQRGLHVVITKNDSVLVAFDQAHDVTEAVAAELNKQQAASPPAPALVAKSDGSTPTRR